jgi:hypothetical protein
VPEWGFLLIKPYDKPGAHICIGGECPPASFACMPSAPVLLTVSALPLYRRPGGHWVKQRAVRTWMLQRHFRWWRAKVEHHGTCYHGAVGQLA